MNLEKEEREEFRRIVRCRTYDDFMEYARKNSSLLEYAVVWAAAEAGQTEEDIRALYAQYAEKAIEAFRRSGRKTAIRR